MGITVLFVVFIVLLFLGFPIVVAMGVASLSPALIGSAGATTVSALVRSIFGSADSTTLLAIPLFILAGILMSEGKIAEKLFDIFSYFIGDRAAGLPCAVVITCLFYGAISGSAAATAAAVGGMTYPLLTNLGYEKKFSAAIIATAGGLGVIIPPSIPFVIFASVTGTSIGDLFLAGIAPGIFIGVSLIVYCIIFCKRHTADREKIMAHASRLRKKGFLRILVDGIWALLSPVIVLGGIYAGFFTPTEAACVSVFYSLIISLFVYKSIHVRDLWGIFQAAARSLAPMCLILPLATAFGRVLTMLKAPILLQEFIVNYFFSKNGVLTVLIIVLFLLGMLMDTTPTILVLAPLLQPLMLALGVDMVHFGIILTVCLAIGCVTPPFGVNLFVVSAQSKIPPLEIGKAAIPAICVFTVCMILITFIPQICLFIL